MAGGDPLRALCLIVFVMQLLARASEQSEIRRREGRSSDDIIDSSIRLIVVLIIFFLPFPYFFFFFFFFFPSLPGLSQCLHKGGIHLGALFTIRNRVLMVLNGHWRKRNQL